MNLTITRPFNADHRDPFEILIAFGNAQTVILHAQDRPASDRLLIALMDSLTSIEYKP